MPRFVDARKMRRDELAALFPSDDQAPATSDKNELIRLLKERSILDKEGRWWKDGGLTAEEIDSFTRDVGGVHDPTDIPNKDPDRYYYLESDPTMIDYRVRVQGYKVHDGPLKDKFDPRFGTLLEQPMVIHEAREKKKAEIRDNALGNTELQEREIRRTLGDNKGVEFTQTLKKGTIRVSPSGVVTKAEVHKE